MNRFAVLFYGIVCYAIFFGTFLYSIGFLANFGVPKSIDVNPASVTTASPFIAAAINIALVAMFGLQHSIMARIGFKRWWTRFVPVSLERQTYVLATCLCLGALFFWTVGPLFISYLSHHLDAWTQNALRYSPPGGTITVEAFSEGDQVALAVENRGRIPGRDLPNIFERLYRGDTGRSSRGSGLGLTIARAVAENHGGAITARDGQLEISNSTFTGNSATTDGGAIRGIVMGTATVTSPTTVDVVTTEANTETYTATKGIIVATGTQMITIPGFEPGKRILVNSLSKRSRLAMTLGLDPEIEIVVAGVEEVLGVQAALVDYRPTWRSARS